MPSPPPHTHTLKHTPHTCKDDLVKHGSFQGGISYAQRVLNYFCTFVANALSYLHCRGQSTLVWLMIVPETLLNLL